MHASEQLTAEFTITAVCTVTDPAERQRRLTRAYGLIMDFGRQERAATQAESDDSAQPAD
jgi:hypothetical protein